MQVTQAAGGRHALPEVLLCDVRNAITVKVAE
jgi:hypothetical protein